jgi:hypothetical protein
MIAIQHLPPGTRIRLADGAVAEIRENPRDGTWVIARRVLPQGEPSGDSPAQAGGTDDLVHVDDIVEVIVG